MAEPSKPAKRSKSIHEGHRSRMKNRFLEQGLESFEPHEVLEMLLFYGIPQGNTNPLAHQLLDTFGSISKVFDAPLEALEDVKGIGRSSAILLKMIPQLTRIYLDDLTSSTPLTENKDIANYLLPKFVGRKEEVFLLLLLNSRQEVLFCDVMNEGSIREVAIHIRKIVQLATNYNADSAVLAHNHPSGNLAPSSNDLTMTAEIYYALEPVGVNLRDHMILAGDGKTYLSMQKSGLLERILKGRR